MYKDFTDMPVWQLAMEASEVIFQMTNELPRNEDYGLTSQLRRAAVSISANIAEAFGRSSAADKNKFYDYAKGSAFETKSLVLYGNKVGYFNQEHSDIIIGKMNIIIHDINKVKLALSQPKSNPQS